MEEPQRRLVGQTKQFRQAHAGKPISDEDAREMIESITGFFKVLLEWDEKENNQTSSPE